MNLKRAIWIGVLTYLASFIFGIAVMIGLGVDPTQTSEISNTYFLINIIITVVIAALFSVYYFKDKKIKPSSKEGFLFGVVLIILGFILDIIVFSIFAAFSDSQQGILDYYANPLFWLALILLLVVTTAVGAVKQKKRR